MTEATESARVEGTTPGAVLAAARSAAGLTPADVAGQMRISLRQVEAIEADRYELLPGAVFVRGFVRNYARLLNLDPAPLLDALEPTIGGDTPLRAQHYEGAMPDSRRSHARLWLALFLMVLAIVLGAAAYEYWRGRTAAVSAVVPAETSATASVKAESPAPAAAPVVAEPVPITPERVPDAPGAAAGIGGEPAPASAVPPREAAVAASGVAQLRIEFVRESWVEVREISGKVLFSGTGAPGTSRTIDGTAPFEVVVGNASGVQITYNQKPVDVVARSTRNIARFTLE